VVAFGDSFPGGRSHHQTVHRDPVHYATAVSRAFIGREMALISCLKNITQQHVNSNRHRGGIGLGSGSGGGECSGSPGTGNVATFSSLWRSRTALDPTVELPAVLVTGSYLYPGSVWQAGKPVRGPSRWHHVQTPGISIPLQIPRSPRPINSFLLFRLFTSDPNSVTLLAREFDYYVQV